ncbi:restriction endonuclease subunit S [Cellulophaga sp. HaHaR_3_176]|uniref:restriction endonuclease subunit S n=1 Tax=Cellulophaga sp. HaHaR_3_176 TaxID=1942464 RepID=UPI001C1FB69E|nr:restriction endonuclease subunit S [Cellulophaga sp. HaHaR_3_176]QWX85032.1 restriction endonuclease subunit S [Cellulophaga sp. HaHaR_3_176]
MKVDFNHIPKGWKKVKIAKKLFFQEGPGVRKWQFTDKGIKLLNVGNINNGKVDLSATDKHLSTEEATGKYAHFLIDEGDLLIACSGIVVDNFHNKIAFAKKEHLPLCLNTSTMRFKALKDDVDLNYFKYYLQTVHFTSQLQKLITGSAQLNFGPSHIKKIDFLLPPLKTQKHIAQILDDAAALRDKTKQLLKEYDLLAQAIFLEMFGDPVINEKGWEENPIGAYINIKHGYAFKSEFFVPKSSYTLLTPGNFNEAGGYKSQGQKQKYYDGDIPNDYILKNGDILIAMTEQATGLLGSVISVPEEGIFLHNQRLGLIEYKKNLNSTFIYTVFNQKNIRARIQMESTGTKVKHTSPKKLMDITIGFPPIKLQNQFAEKITLIDQQKKLAKQELQESEDLFNCLLQKAFKGELV